MKQKQKKYKDNKQYVKPHQIKIGDQVLLKQKSTKRHPPYDPDPYTVTTIRGHQITACRGSQKKTRDAQKWKKVSIRTPTNYNDIRNTESKRRLRNSHEDIFDIEGPQYEVTAAVEQGLGRLWLPHHSQPVPDIRDGNGRNQTGMVNG